MQLSPALDPTRPHLNVAIIGHSGHGKTRLAAALTERSFVHESRPWARTTRRINYVDGASYTIRGDLVRHAHTNVVEHESPFRHYDSLDVPGARRLADAAIAACSTADAAILVVSAADGALSQSREHALFAKALGVGHLIVFLSHCDRVSDPEQLDLAENDVREVLTEVGFDGDSVVFVRGALGDAQLAEHWAATVDELISALDRAVADPARDAESPARVTVLWRYDRYGDDSSIGLAHVRQGTIRANDTLELMFRGMRFSVKILEIRAFDRPVAVAGAGDVVTIKLQAARDLVNWRMVLRRGALLTARKNLQFVTSALAQLRLLSRDEGGRHNAIMSGHRGYFCFGSTAVAGRIVLPPGIDTLAPGASVERAIVEFQVGITVEAQQRFVLRDGCDGLQRRYGGGAKWSGTCATGVLTQLRDGAPTALEER